MAIPEYNYIPEYTRLGVNNKPKDVITASYWNGLFNALSHQGDHTAEELGNVLNHFTAAINDVEGIAGSKYVKPTNGIPKTDLAAAVQTSLDKADTALQTHQSLVAYRTAEAQDLIDNMKQDKLIAGENITIAADGKTISAAGVGVLEVTLTTQNGVSTADKTFEQVKAAVESGAPVLKVHSDGALLWFFLLDKSPTEIDFVGLVDEQIIAYLTAKQDGSWETTVAARVTAEMLSSLNDKIGNIGQLTTTDKTNLVAAMNEVKQAADSKQDKLIAGENITIAADGKTISATGGGSSVPKPLTYDYMPEGYPSKTVETVTLLEEQEFAFPDDSGGVATLSNPLVLVEGQTYTVTWDGTEYECVCAFISETYLLGNLSIAGAGDDTGEPFFYTSNWEAFVTLDRSPTHTIGVKTTGRTVTPMAEEFIPPMNVSAFTNDAGYLTLATLPKYGGESV